jgi:hypothetical protein
MAASKTKLRARADALREILLHPADHPDIFDAPGDPELYAVDAAPVGDKLAKLVGQHADLEERAAWLLHESGFKSGSIEEWAGHAEYAALLRLLQSQAAAKALIDPNLSATAAVHGSLGGKFGGNEMDFAALAAAIKDQADKVAGGDRATIRATMSTIALVVQ